MNIQYRMDGEDTGVPTGDQSTPDAGTPESTSSDAPTEQPEGDAGSDASDATETPAN